MKKNRGEAIKKLNQVRGHLVVLPLHFLEDSIDATSLADLIAITKGREDSVTEGHEESKPVITYW